MRPVHCSVYEIIIKGPLSPRWQTWFDDFQIETDRDGNTLLTGPLPDQAALHGLLARVRDLGLVLLSLRLLSVSDNKPIKPEGQIKK